MDAQDDAYLHLRRLGALARQLHAAVRGADRFGTLGQPADRDTACWLAATAVDLAHEICTDLDALAHDAGRGGPGRADVDAWRALAHQLHAVCRAGDHFLEQDAAADREAGGWLVARGLALGERLAAALEDGASRLRPASVPAVPAEAQDLEPRRRPVSPATPIRGAR